MEEPQQQILLDEEATLVVCGEETTLVAPRFGDEETSVARPVVPLEEDAPRANSAPATPVYRSPYAPRRTGLLALVLISVLVGGVLGGAGLYLYQRQSQNPSAATTDTAEPTAPTAPGDDAAQAPPAAAAEVQPAAPNAAPTVQPTAEPTAAVPNAEEETTPNAPSEQAPAAAPARAPENVPAAERRADPASSTPKRGKKGNRDEEVEHRTNSQPDGNVARSEEPEARRVDSIFYRPRRANRRTHRDDGGDADRLRRIFEGGPQ